MLARHLLDYTMNNNIGWPTDLTGRIPQRIAVKKISNDLDCDYDIGLWMGMRHDNVELFEWINEKNIEVRSERITMLAEWEQLMVITALFDTPENLMECLMKFDLPVE